MNIKKRLFVILVTLFLGGIVFYYGSMNRLEKTSISSVYQIYLDGEKIGLINSQDDLYKLINQEQSSIKSKYDVDQVYPPKGFSITKLNTYNDDVVSVEDIYNTIKESKNFTVRGYTITVSSNQTEDEEAKTLFRINVLDKQVFEDAINNVIKSFISEEQVKAYINNEQMEIVDTGERIENIYFQENISIKETYISTDEVIYTDADSLSKFLLFGNNNKEKEYTVKLGDTISNIAEDNELNVSEFLVANPSFKSENDLLAVGDKVVISLINPMLTLVYDKYTVVDVVEKYSTVTKYDYSKDSSYKAVETKGVNGIRRVASTTQYINGDANQGAIIDQTKSYVLRETVNEVIVRGRSSNYGYYVDDGTDWAWPTNKPYMITSGFGTRYLFNRSSHDGLDISGTGYGSPIYAVASGTVYSAQYGGIAGPTAGINIVIEHPNGYWTVYMHLSAVYVKPGQHVERAEKIGAMGNTGQVTGTHLHLGVFTGKPYNGGKAINPMLLYK